MSKCVVQICTMMCHLRWICALRIKRLLDDSIYMHIEYKHRDGMHVDVLIVNNKKDGAIQKHKLPILISF